MSSREGALGPVGFSVDPPRAKVFVVSRDPPCRGHGICQVPVTAEKIYWRVDSQRALYVASVALCTREER